MTEFWFKYSIKDVPSNTASSGSANHCAPFLLNSLLESLRINPSTSARPLALLSQLLLLRAKDSYDDFSALKHYLSGDSETRMRWLSSWSTQRVIVCTERCSKREEKKSKEKKKATLRENHAFNILARLILYPVS